MTTKRKRLPVRAASKVYPEDKSDGSPATDTESEYLGYLFNDGDVVDDNELNELQNNIAEKLQHIHNEMKMHEDYWDIANPGGYNDSRPSASNSASPGGYTPDPDAWTVVTDTGSFRHRAQTIEVVTATTNDNGIVVDGVDTTSLSKSTNYENVEQAIANLSTNHAHYEDHVTTPEGNSDIHAEFTVGTTSSGTPAIFAVKTAGEELQHVSGASVLMHNFGMNGDDV